MCKHIKRDGKGPNNRSKPSRANQPAQKEERIENVRNRKHTIGCSESLYLNIKIKI